MKRIITLLSVGFILIGAAAAAAQEEGDTFDPLELTLT